MSPERPFGLLPWTQNANRPALGPRTLPRRHVGPESAAAHGPARRLLSHQRMSAPTYDQESHHGNP